MKNITNNEPEKKSTDPEQNVTETILEANKTIERILGSYLNKDSITEKF